MSDHPSPQTSHPGHQAQPSHPAHSAQPPYLAATATPAEASRAMRLLALTAVGLGVAVLAAAAFVLSYPGIHGIARQAGVSASLARVYPVIFDAMLVIACAAVLSLRGAGLVSRCYAWLSLLALLGAAAGADALQSTGIRLPHRIAAASAAITPWALVLIGFGLLLAMLRHARLHRAPAVPGGQPPPYRPAGPPPVAALPPGAGQQGPPVGMSQPPATGPPAMGPPSAMGQLAAPAQPPDRALPAAPASSTVRAAPSAVQVAAPETRGAPARVDQPQLDAELAHPAHPAHPAQPADPAHPADPARPAPAHPDPAMLNVPRQAVREAAGDRADHAGSQPDQGLEPASEADPGQGRPASDEVPYAAAPQPPEAREEDPEDEGSGQDAAPPAFHRMWSSPTPPGEDYEG